MNFIEPIRAVPPSHYQVYLGTTEWRLTRNRALKRASYQCSRCPSKRDLDVHHKTYERLGREWDQDLEVLCVMCHRGEHLENPDQTSLGIYLRIASAALKKEPFASVADLADMVKTACAKLKIPQVEGRINAAIEVMIGNRLQSPLKEHRPVKADPMALSRGDARELMIRLGEKFPELLGAKSIPEVSLTATQQQAHEDRMFAEIKAEQKEQYQREHRPESTREALERIFSTRPA